MTQTPWPILGVVSLLISGCAGTPELDLVVHEAPKGAVYLERIPDDAARTAHPITIDEDLIARAFRGIIVTEKNTTVQAAFSKKSTPSRAFSEDDIRFLTPFLTIALRQAAADQQVGFQVRRYPATLSFSRQGGAAVGSSEPLLADSTLLETTSGHLLADDHWLYLTVSQFRTRTERADAINMANRRLPDPSGQADKELRFEPQEALQPGTGKPSGLFGSSAEASFVIDYGRLAQFAPTEGQPPPEAEPRVAEPIGQPAVNERRLELIQDELKNKDAEIETLRQEMEDIRRQLGKTAPRAP